MAARLAATPWLQGCRRCHGWRLGGNTTSGGAPLGARLPPKGLSQMRCPRESWAPPSPKAFTAKFCRAIQGRELSATFADLLQDIFYMARSNNIITENRFARAAKQQSTCQGHSIDVTTMASNHLLSELQLQHHVAMERSIAEQRERPQIVGDQGRTVFKNPWAAFKHARRDLSTAQQIEQWRAFTQEQKQPYRNMFLANPWVGKAVSKRVRSRGRRPPQPVLQTRPWGFGTDRFPLSPDDIDVSRIQSESKEFVDHHGPVIQARTRKELPVARTCGELYGFGRCQHDFASGEFQKFLAHKRMLHTLAFSVAAFPKRDGYENLRLFKLKGGDKDRRAIPIGSGKTLTALSL